MGYSESVDGGSWPAVGKKVAELAQRNQGQDQTVSLRMLASN